jgi:predicted glycoside hydrolase/deacetylase ChbG (UPF0249 family)
MKRILSFLMISVTLLCVVIISYFHYNQLPIYDLDLALKFIKNSTQKEDFKTIAEKLGYSEDDKLLVIHADDLGLEESVNSTSFESLKKNTVSSASVIMTTINIDEIANFSELNPTLDLGVHLTVTSEWKMHKWGGILQNKDIPSMLNSNNHFYCNKRKFTKFSNLDEVRNELQAQIDLAVSMGINISHIDSHEGALFFDPDVFKMYLNLAKRNNLLAFVPIQASVHFDENFPKPDHAIIFDQFFMAEAGIKPNEMEKYYLDILDNLKPGLSQIIVHFGLDNDKMKDITQGKTNYGSLWREIDYNVMNSEKFIKSLEENNIKLINYSDLKNVIF